MKRVVLMAAVSAILLAAFAANAQATCGNQCLNAKVTQLQHTVSVDTQALRAIVGCFRETPITLYGDAATNSFGYAFADGAGNVFATSALNATQPGDQISAWMLYDHCNTRQHGAVDSAHAARAGTGLLAGMLDQAGSAILNGIGLLTNGILNPTKDKP